MKVLCGIITIIVYLLLASLHQNGTVSKFDKNREDYYREISNKMFEYYKLNNEVPQSMDFLPKRLENVLRDDKSGITWNPCEATLRCKFSRDYPMKVSLSSFLTFGMIDNNTYVSEISVSREQISKNSRLF